MRRLALIVALTSLWCSGCVSVNQQMNASHKAIANKAPASRAPAGGAYKAMPWKVGQWALYAQRNEEVWVTQKISVVGRSGAMYWLEIETLDPRGEAKTALMKMQVSGYNAGDPASVRKLRIGKVITQSEGARAMLAPAFIGPMTSNWVLSSFSIDTSKGGAGKAVVPAGTFSGAVKVRTETKWGPIEVIADTWLHKAVPIWGIVKSRSTDGEHEQRLLDFGMSGATSKISGKVLGMGGPWG